jgi:predicted RNase H-like nuclease
MRVAGLDGCKTGWMGVALQDGAFSDARAFLTAEDALRAWADMVVLAIDIPIGLPDASTRFRRHADSAARGYLGRAASSVFSTLPREVLAEPDYGLALALNRSLVGGGITKQSHALRTKILEVDHLAAREPRVYEVHPEVSFRAMSGGKPMGSKRSWNGLMLRRSCLLSVGIRVPDELPAAEGVGADDVLDAAAAAWSAMRIATKEAKTLPASPPVDANGRPVAIYY